MTAFITEGLERDLEVFAFLTVPIFSRNLVRNSELRCPLSPFLRGALEPHDETGWEVLPGVRPQSFLFRLELRSLRERLPPEIKRVQSRARRASARPSSGAPGGSPRCAGAGPLPPAAGPGRGGGRARTKSDPALRASLDFECPAVAGVRRRRAGRPGPSPHPSSGRDAPLLKKENV